MVPEGCGSTPAVHVLRVNADGCDRPVQHGKSGTTTQKFVAERSLGCSLLVRAGSRDALATICRAVGLVVRRCNGSRSAAMTEPTESSIVSAHNMNKLIIILTTTPFNSRIMLMNFTTL